MATYRAGAKLAALLLPAALAACARSGGPAPVIQGGGGPPAQEQRRAETKKPVARDEGAIEIHAGDTLYSIARQYGVSLRGLIDRNKLAPPFVLEPGQRLVLPVPRVYVVVRGDTIYGIARRFGLQMRDVIQSNAIRPPYVISPGQKLRLPGADSEQKVARATPEAQGVVKAAQDAFSALSTAPAREDAKPDQTASVPPPTVVVPRPRGPATLAPPPPREGGKFLWPVEGRLLVRFGSRGGGMHNDGINIAASVGTPVRAAEAGVVAYAGNELQGFGNLLLIKHTGGWMSAYAHGRELLVSRGDLVRRGQTIARVGQTGNVTRPQLHFELRRGDRAVDPLPYLERLAWLPRFRFVAAVSP